MDNINYLCPLCSTIGYKERITILESLIHRCAQRHTDVGKVSDWATLGSESLLIDTASVLICLVLSSLTLCTASLPYALPDFFFALLICSVRRQRKS